MTDAISRLQIPDAGPSQLSRSVGPGTAPTGSSNGRPSSAQVYPTSAPHTAPSHQGDRSRKQRASHQVTSSQPEREEQVGYRDVYSHPAAVAYAAAHPRRTIPKFGPYLLLQTLGEGEFGKVKLGLHSQWGEEVAVKLIRRGNIDTAIRMSKVEREIEVLRTIKHPNIVRLYDVIETDKYIGIILEYASGGELFDHILAHRYLKERDACKLFAQLVSGVWYIHQKKIVHRDLKLENLLLDRHRNVIITDFGFANRFEHRADDLMQTSCGSPCYAAPELVISEGLYVGSAVDIWSCGVILYAMLAGYLPFDDDPANPDGDNINLLYRYIVNTPLTFPDYVSSDARDLLSIMLVPDPTQRADLNQIMVHHWLKPYAHLFDRTVQDLERLAMEQHQMKRLAYQRQMKQQAAAAAAAEQQKMQRSHSARVEASASVTNNGRSHQALPPVANQNYLYEANPDESLFSSPAPVPVSRKHPASAVVTPSQSGYDDDPFGPMPSQARPAEEPRTRKGSATGSRSSRKQQPPPSAMDNVKTSPERRKADRQRHTIQLEYGGEPQEEVRPPHPTPKAKQKAKAQQVYEPEPPAMENVAMDAEDDARMVTVDDPLASNEPLTPEVELVSFDRNGSISQASKPLPTPPGSGAGGDITPKTSSSMRINGSQQEISESIPSDIESVKPPSVAVIPTSPSRNGTAYDGQPDINGSSRTGSVNSGASGSSKGRHRRGMSVDKIVGKLWGASSDTEGAPANGIKARRPSNSNVTPTGTWRTPSFTGSKRPSTVEVQPGAPSAAPESKASAQSAADAAKAEAKKSRRNTLTVMVQPLSKRISQRSKSRGEAAPIAMDSRTSEKTFIPPVVPPKQVGKENVIPDASNFATVDANGSIPASTNKASKVMQWFRYRSKSREPSVGSDYEPTESSERAQTPTADEKETPISDPQTPRAASFQPRGTISQPSVTRAAPMNRSVSSQTDTSIPPTPSSFLPRTMNRLSNMVGSPQPMRPLYNKSAIRPHRGAVDQTTVTTGSPPDVMAHVTKILLDMGLEVQQESEYKYRCIRSKKRKMPTSATAPGGLTALNMVGSAASSGVDKRGLPMPSQSSFSSTSGMLKGLLMRRQSSQVSSHHSLESDSQIEGRDILKSSRTSREKLSVLPSAPQHEPIYGDRSIDQGDEVRFSVELTRLEGLEDTFSIEIRRLKGHLRSYKFLYDAVRGRLDVSR